MIDGLMIFLGGLLGSSHCIGMCGGFALTLGSLSSRLWVNVVRQIAYSLGRIFTYSVLGTAAAYAGWRLMHQWQAVVQVQAILSIAAGLLLLFQGLSAAGVFGWLRRPRSEPIPIRRGDTIALPMISPSAEVCLGSSLFAGLLQASRLRSVFLGGVVNGLLPCGLVYAYLALAASAGDLLRGGAILALFGLGTVPVMVLVGCGGSALGRLDRRPLFRVAAWCVAATGLVSLLRGFGFLRGFAPWLGPSCPLCP